MRLNSALMFSEEIDVGLNAWNKNIQIKNEKRNEKSTAVCCGIAGRKQCLGADSTGGFQEGYYALCK